MDLSLEADFSVQAHGSAFTASRLSSSRVAPSKAPAGRTDEMILLEDQRVVYYPHDTFADQLVPKSFIRSSDNGRDAIALRPHGPVQEGEALRRVLAGVR